MHAGTDTWLIRPACLTSTTAYAVYLTLREILNILEIYLIFSFDNPEILPGLWKFRGAMAFVAIAIDMMQLLIGNHITYERKMCNHAESIS